ncbi:MULTISPECIES: hypothetical protein [unclassified Romboutsia]|uniref:hypothetical protein n=1 Tax=unclassified Romboutsia TaxID=2626894 RepID=UPI0008225EE0|nr:MULTISPECIES: hypothetical protein [unclassified Romboutsia]SCH17282.1 Uncharacterised protein [uncultured Clostridium sp.]
MEIVNLDLETRSKIYSYTKKVLRKYQKGIITGKLTADKFAENILSDGSINDILDEKYTHEPEFKDSYIDYINTLITIQNDNISKGKKKKYKNEPKTKPNIPQKIKLKNLLESTGFTLTIPMEYLNSNDLDNIIKYIQTGSIDLGNEKIYNYVNTSNTH